MEKSMPEVLNSLTQYFIRRVKEDGLIKEEKNITGSDEDGRKENKTIL